MKKTEAFTFLDHMAQGIAVMFGESCETVVQEIIENEITTVSIYNGHVSGREVNSKIGILGGIMDSQDVNYVNMLKSNHNQLVLHPSGKKIKSASFVMKEEEYCYILGINYDVTLMERMQHMLNNFMVFDGSLYETMEGEGAKTLGGIYESCVSKMTLPEGKLSKERRLALLQMLHQQGFFELQKSIPFLASKLGVSKYTIYKDLGELNIK